MPFNGSGTFTRLRSWVSDATAGIKIRADYHDQEDDGFAAGLSNTITRDGQSVVTANIPWNGKRLINVGDPVNDQDALTKLWAQNNIVAGAHIADAPPAAAKVGNLWWSSDTGDLFVKFDDGTSTQWVQVNVAPQAIIPPPQDGNEYALVNGQWQLKSQSFDLAGLSQKDIAVPAWGPKTMRMSVFFVNPGTACQMGMRLSTDGTTFLTGATDYGHLFSAFRSGSSGYGSGSANASIMPIGGTGDNANGIPQVADILLRLTHPSGHLTYQAQCSVYDSTATALHTNVLYRGYAPVATIPAGTNVKAVRWLTSPVVAASSGELNVEWLS